ncbi:MAG: ORF6N domain-containing protein, partial [Burkholderiales bacterium]|nr:ORF6N domain-containing protein [Burkholderiales bacterium]
MQILEYNKIESRIIEIRNVKIILDNEVAQFYDVETKRINEAVNRNPEKFPEGYIIELTEAEKAEVVAKCGHLQTLKFSSALPKGFTEKGLYMLATILKSPTATQTTLLIIETFAKVREIGHTVNQLTVLPEGSPKQKALIHRTGELL